jgi:hypothetical protein
MPHTSCLYDFDKGEVPNCIQKSSNGEPFVTKRVLREFRFDSQGLAVLKSATNGWMYVSRAGRIVISGVPTMDNWADTFHDGLVQVTRNGKYGFSNPDGHLITPPIYDGAMNFDHGKAKVCQGCTSKCVDQECEYHVFSGGDWLEIDTKGTSFLARGPRNERQRHRRAWLVGWSQRVDATLS